MKEQVVNLIGLSLYIVSIILWGLVWWVGWNFNLVEVFPQIVRIPFAGGVMLELLRRAWGVDYYLNSKLYGLCRAAMNLTKEEQEARDFKDGLLVLTMPLIIAFLLWLLSSTVVNFFL